MKYIAGVERKTGAMREGTFQWRMSGTLLALGLPKKGGKNNARSAGYCYADTVSTRKKVPVTGADHLWEWLL